jgi:16S rRNA (cytidine1402-2'-O)-methyltransferase
MPCGTLFIVGVPIGNLEDISVRALNTLRGVDAIACEDTRHFSKLLNRYDIKTPLISYHKYNEKQRQSKLLGMLQHGRNIALVSNAGMPGISDPGHVIIEAAIRKQVPVTVIPGPSAMLSALVLSGLDMSQFTFCGFIPARPAHRRKRYIELQYEERTLIFFETGNRLAASLRDMREVFGDRRISMARELTKLHEEVRRMTLGKFIEWLGDRELPGEIVLCVEGNRDKEDWSTVPIEEHVRQVMETLGISKNEAIKAVSRLRGVQRREVYDKMKKN